MSCAPSSSTKSAVQRALGIADIVSMVVDLIYDDLQLLLSDHHRCGCCPIWPEKKRALAPLACVNRLWFAMAIPVLWRQPCQTKGDPCLGRLLWHIAPARRNLYAKHVKAGAVQTFRRKPTVPVRMPRGVRVDPEQERRRLEEEAIGTMLAGVDFPKLECLTIRDTAYNRIPQLGSQNVKLVLLKPHIEEDGTPGIRVKDIEPVLGQLPVRHRH
ncbi:hypothetical protein PG997_002596 [Apiospora hydei]|uniref:Uncharacterized protein n=1 Tax=Apiospora hydei TaxID=1337664 RepID=A0ABR1WWW4_9PEZI